MLILCQVLRNLELRLDVLEEEAVSSGLVWFVLQLRIAHWRAAGASIDTMYGCAGMHFSTSGWREPASMLVVQSQRMCASVVHTTGTANPVVLLFFAKLLLHRCSFRHSDILVAPLHILAQALPVTFLSGRVGELVVRYRAADALQHVRAYANVCVWLHVCLLAPKNS